MSIREGHVELLAMTEVVRACIRCRDEVGMDVEHSLSAALPAAVEDIDVDGGILDRADAVPVTGLCPGSKCIRVGEVLSEIPQTDACLVADVAEHTGLNESEVISIHSGTEYLIYIEKRIEKLEK